MHAGSQQDGPDSGRVARRRARMRRALVAAAVRQFAARGVDAVSVAGLIAEADVSRATFYQLFSSKYKILEHILNPVFDDAIRGAEALCSGPPEAVVDGLAELYLSLWRAHRDGLALIPIVDASEFQRFAARHARLNAALLDALSLAEQAELLRNGSARFSLKVVARTAIPLLGVYESHPAFAGLFRDALRSLLLRSH